MSTRISVSTSCNTKLKVSTFPVLHVRPAWKSRHLLRTLSTLYTLCTLRSVCSLIPVYPCNLCSLVPRVPCVSLYHVYPVFHVFPCTFCSLLPCVPFYPVFPVFLVPRVPCDPCTPCSLVPCVLCGSLYPVYHVFPCTLCSLHFLEPCVFLVPLYSAFPVFLVPCVSWIPLYLLFPCTLSWYHMPICQGQQGTIIHPSPHTPTLWNVLLFRYHMQRAAEDYYSPQSPHLHPMRGSAILLSYATGSRGLSFTPVPTPLQYEGFYYPVIIGQGQQRTIIHPSPHTPTLWGVLLFRYHMPRAAEDSQ